MSFTSGSTPKKKPTKIPSPVFSELVWKRRQDFYKKILSTCIFPSVTLLLQKIMKKFLFLKLNEIFRFPDFLRRKRLLAPFPL